VVYDEVVSVESFVLSVGFCVLEQMKEELGRLLRPATLGGAVDLSLKNTKNGKLISKYIQWCHTNFSIGHEGSVGMSVCKVHISATRWRRFTLTAVALRFCKATAVWVKKRHLVAEINVGLQQRA
jgi:hypothetical protein